jgi:hypothetical protein
MRRLCVTLLAVLALVSGACGGSSKDPKAAFSDGANAACRKAYTGFKAVGNPEQSVAGVDAWVGKVEPLFTTLQSDLKALTPPPGDEQKVQAMISAVGAVTTQLDALKTAVDNGDLAGLNAASQSFQTAADSAQSVFKNYGLTNCA